MASLTARTNESAALEDRHFRACRRVEGKKPSVREINVIEKYVAQLEKELKELEKKINSDDNAGDDDQAPEGYVAMNDDGDEANDAADVASTTPAAKKPRTLPATDVGKWNPVSSYGWDQSNKFVTVYVSGLDGVGDLPKENIVCNFEEDAFDLTVKDLNGKSYRLNVTNLDKSIDVKRSKIKVKSSRVNVMLRKVDGKCSPDHWSDLRSKQSKDAKERLEKDPSAGIMDLMKDMYNSGDDKMRETIGKAMLESQRTEAKTPLLTYGLLGGNWT